MNPGSLLRRIQEFSLRLGQAHKAAFQEPKCGLCCTCALPGSGGTWLEPPATPVGGNRHPLPKEKSKLVNFMFGKWLPHYITHKNWTSRVRFFFYQVQILHVPQDDVILWWNVRREVGVLTSLWCFLWADGCLQAGRLHFLWLFLPSIL